MTSITPLIVKTSIAAVSLKNVSEKQLKTALNALAKSLEANSAALLRANKKDLAKQSADNPRNDRLLLNEQRIKNIAASIRTISKLPDPSGKLLESRTLKNGLLLEKVTVPLGVVGAIYESRPNVTFDIAALCLRSRNGCVLKGSSEADNTNRAAVSLIKKILKEHGIHPDCVTLLPPDREVVQELFTATKYVDVLIPRGSDSLIQYVRKNSQVPVIETGAGVCHVYVEKEASISKALNIAVNAKVSRPSVCNAADTILVDAAIAPAFLQKLHPRLAEHGVEIFAEAKAYKLLKDYPFLQLATADDFGREFLSLK